jgi:hypothetical protein
MRVALSGGSVELRGGLDGSGRDANEQRALLDLVTRVREDFVDDPVYGGDDGGLELHSLDDQESLTRGDGVTRGDLGSQYGPRGRRVDGTVRVARVP